MNRWRRVLVAFGVDDGVGVNGDAMTAARAQKMASGYSNPVRDEAVVVPTALEAARTGQQGTATPTADPLGLCRQVAD